jgi:type VI secretion system protein ImpC
MQLDDFPYVILALAPFAPVPDGPYQPQGMPVDLTTLDAALEAMAPVLRVETPKAFCPGVWVEIAPRKMKHFRPDGVVEVCNYLKRVSEAAKLVENARSAGQSLASIADKLKNEYKDIPLDIRLAAPKPSAPSAADDLLAMVAMPETSTSGAGGDLNALKTQCEQIMAGVLQAIFAAPEFRACEAAWRGLETLLKQGGVKEGARVKVVIASIGERNFEPALDELASALAASAPQLVLLDLALDSAPERIQQLEKIASFGDTLLAPTAVELSPRFFHIQDWSELKKIPYLKHFLEDAAYAKWRKLQENPMAIWLAPLINRFLTRPRYGEENRPKPVFFQEEAPLWLNPVWALGALVAQSVLQHGWPSRFTDYMTVRLTDLPVSQEAGSPMSTQMAVPDTRLAEFIQVGITPLLGASYKDFVMLPKETTAGGYPLSYQLFVNQTLGFFMWCKENLGGQIAGDVAGGLTQAFGLYWQLTGHKPPSDISIEPQAGEAGAGLLAIGFTPPSSVIPGGQRLEFTFSW